MSLTGFPPYKVAVVLEQKPTALRQILVQNHTVLFGSSTVQYVHVVTGVVTSPLPKIIPLLAMSRLSLWRMSCVGDFICL